LISNTLSPYLRSELHETAYLSLEPVESMLLSMIRAFNLLKEYVLKKKRRRLKEIEKDQGKEDIFNHHNHGKNLDGKGNKNRRKLLQEDEKYYDLIMMVRYDLFFFYDLDFEMIINYNSILYSKMNLSSYSMINEYEENHDQHQQYKVSNNTTIKEEEEDIFQTQLIISLKKKYGWLMEEYHKVQLRKHKNVQTIQKLLLDKKNIQKDDFDKKVALKIQLDYQQVYKPQKINLEYIWIPTWCNIITSGFSDIFVFFDFLCYVYSFEIL